MGVKRRRYRSLWPVSRVSVSGSLHLIREKLRAEKARSSWAGPSNYQE